MSESKRIVVGLDLGKATMSIASAVISEDGSLSEIQTRSERHLGSPLEYFKDLYNELDRDNIAAIAATGAFSNRLKDPIISEVPEETAQEIATLHLFNDKRPLNILRMGARGYSILTIDEDGNVRFEENDKCSSGTGETVEKICGRLGLSLDEALAVVKKANESIPISARCSVFAKSEMTHFANQGEPHEKLIKGYFESVARNLFSLYDKFKVDGPVVLIGHGAAMEPVRDAFSELCSAPVSVSPEFGVYEAIGAMYLAAERANGNFTWPEDPQLLIREKRKRIETLEPASVAAGRVTVMKEEDVTVPPDSPVVMGIDLGSTGSKAALVDVKTGQVVADLYRRTDGNPVEAAKALVAGLSEMTEHPIVAFGLCGSGRYAAATVFKAAYPDMDGRIFVQNEIVAHATAAAKYDDRNGQSLSVVEIGGQDAKFINMQGGRIVESDMNRACSAGTGSFLEEQAVFYGIDDVTKFGPMAASSKSPPNLGQMCTVFVAELASEALSEGYTIEDLFAGFQYSVIVNYTNRVMGDRQFMDRIFFQGKPAANLSLAQTLAAVTNREVIVPPNPGAMGAIGIGLLAREYLEDLDNASAMDTERILGAAITSRKMFRCKDSKCNNLCRIESATVQIENEQRKIVSGGMCSKYEETYAGHKKLPKEAPNAYLERKELLDSLTETDYKGLQTPTVGIPYGHYVIEFAPFFQVFLKELGYRSNLIYSDHNTFQRGDARCTAQNACTPVKLMHGLADKSLDFLFMPKIVTLPEEKEKTVGSTCPLTQGTPEMVDHALRAEGADVTFLRPIFHMEGKGLESRQFKKELKAFHANLKKHKSNGAPKSFGKAYKKALQAQKTYMDGLAEIGNRTVEFAEKNGFPVILVVGNSHVVHEPIMNAGIHNIISQNGAIALPLDCFAIPDSVSALRRVYWGNSNRAMRAGLAATEKGFIFPALIVSYGCGPSSFLEHVFNDLFENYPHTILESDGHGGQAGYVTRIQAFLHSARSYEKGDKPAVDPKRIKQLDTYPRHSPEKIKNSRIVVMTVGPVIAEHTAVAMRAHGYDAHSGGVTDAEGFKAGRVMCSGKECLPHQLIWGCFHKFLVNNPPTDDKKTLLLNVTGFGPCRNGMFTPANDIAIRRMGLEDKVETMTFGNFRHDPSVFGGIWFTTVVADLLNQMRFHYRPVEKNPGDADRLFQKYLDKMEKFMAVSKRKRSRNPKNMFKGIDPIVKVVTDAALEYKALPIIPEKEKDLRTVFLAGDVFLRIDEWGSDDLARKLNEQGLRVICEPFGELFEYVTLKRSLELVEMENRWLRNKLAGMAQGFVSRKLYEAAMKIHPFIKREHCSIVDEESKELLDGTPFCESILTIGSCLLAWRTRPIDGVVVVSPMGCGPALISEAQLRRRSDIPQLYIYNDGDPIDEARISGFAWRLKRRPARALEPRFNTDENETAAAAM